MRQKPSSRFANREHSRNGLQMHKQKKTQTRIAPGLLRELKAVAALAGRPAYECLEEAAAQWLKRHPLTRQEAQPKK